MLNPDFQNNPPLILVVDDEKTLRLLLGKAMEKEGYLVAEATNGRHCLELCKQRLPDMVLLDAMMPEMDGFTCCSQMQALFGDDCPPILMITVLDAQESVDRAFEAGATDFITKPINWNVLRQRANRLLKSKWAMAELRQQIQKECLLTVQLETANRELQRLATFDSLTQLPNRRYFDEYLQREWKRLQREQLPLSLILCDIDFFKTYNDIYGLSAGDECLCQVAHAIRKNKRRGADLVARYGGEEFVVVLPNTEAEAASQVAEAIRTSVKALGISHTGSEVGECITLSLGVASVISHTANSPEKLLILADTALYQAKLQGRDRAIILEQG